MTRKVITRGLRASTAIAAVFFAAIPAYSQTLPVVTPAPSPALAPTIPSPTPTSPAPVNAPAPAAGPIRALSGTIEPNMGNIRTFMGNIRTFWGDASPFFGNIRTFWGDVNPYEGDLNAFWGGLQTYNGGIRGSAVTPMMGNIRTFWGDVGPLMGNIRTFWSPLGTYSDNTAAYAALATQLTTVVAQSQSTWGASVQAQTGQSFSSAFVNPLLARYGVNLSDPSTLASLSAVQRDQFLIDWYDGLMNYAGTDHVDHWMKEINWSPAISATIGEGKRSVIGLLDFTVTGDGTRNVTKYDGISQFSNGHGAAVASLMIAAHDGKGVMGIAPMASVVAYNPFDETGTAGWADIKAGVLMLAQNNASIINMSLGVPGWTLNQGWNGVFSDPAVAAATKGAVFVAAAGNDGSTQTQNIDWNFATNPNLIVVGSVDPTGTISNFSNRPGTACLLTAGKCVAGSELMNRFIVAPGEFILVSDGQGGVTRMSGTSFAAPLVSGTVALLHDRWPWLSNFPKESVDIILKSARDLGAPGVDPVYGVGELDVAAALSPLNFNNLRWYSYDDKGKIKAEQATKIRSSGEQVKWEAKGMYFYAYEDIGATFRDFAIPLSSKLVGQTVLSSGGTYEQFQSYLYSRMLDWMKTNPTKSSMAFSNIASFSAPVRNSFGLDMSMAVSPRTRLAGFVQSSVPYQSALRIGSPDGAFSMMGGEGDGAVMLGGSTSFGLASDYDPMQGGANPLLGFASGGGYGQFTARIAENLTVSTGMSQRDLRRDTRQFGIADRIALNGVGAYRAQATQVALAYAASDAVRFSLTYTGLHENSALLGVQSTDPSDLAHGSITDGVTIASEAMLTPTLSLAASGTVGRTRQGSTRQQSIAVGDSGLVSSSFQLALTKDKFTSRHDRIRFTVSQPMHVESGSIDLTQVRVIDRQTGELGPVTQSFSLATQNREYVAEMLYGRDVGSSASLNLFGRAHLSDPQAVGATSYIAGGGFKLAFR